jgi:hypothetical protein
VGLEEEAVVGAEPPDDGVREVVGRRGLGLGGLAVGRAVHVARRPRRGVGEGRLPGVQEEGRDGLGQGRICARGGRDGERSGRAAAGRDAGRRLLASGVEAETRLGLFAHLDWAAIGAAAHAAPVVDPPLCTYL